MILNHTNKFETLPPDAEVQLKHLQQVTKPLLGKWPHSAFCSCQGCALLESYSPAMRRVAIHMLQTGEFPIFAEPEPKQKPVPKNPTPERSNHSANSDLPQRSAISMDFAKNIPQFLSAPDQLPHEPAECYDVFLEYCQRNNDRSITELAADLGVSRQTIYRYKADYGWDERLREHKQRQLAACNAAIEPILKEAAINWANSMKELKALQWNLAKLQFQRAYAILSDASTECTIKDAALLVQVASKIGQAAIGDASPTVQEDTGLTRFEQLVHEFAARQKGETTATKLIN